jgi:hypothetical protein
MCNRLLRLCLALFIGCLAALPVFGQVSTGQLSGTVTDPSGAVVSGATVTVIQKGTGTTRTVTTGDTGTYTVPLLPPGTYRVEVTAPNFQKTVLDGVSVRITENTTVDFTLQVGDVSGEVVVVTAEGPLVRTDSSSHGRVIEERSLRQLPLPTRNFQQLLTLSAGTSANITNTSEVGRGDTAINVNGQRTTSNSVLINGIDANSIGTGSTPNLAVPATDSLQEFIVLTSQYDASAGRNAGGIVTAITKSGTNEFHGNAYFFLRDTSLNANNFFLKRQGIDRPTNERYQYGGTLGGPIIKDRLWFFGSYQGTRETNGTSLTNSLSVVGTPPDLTDDRSDAALAALSRARAPGLAAFGQLGFVNPVARRLLQARYPDGSFLIPSGNGQIARILPALSKFREEQFNANVDAQLGNANRLAVKFFFANNRTDQGLFSQFGLGNVLQTPGYPVRTDANNRFLSVTDTHVFASGFINEARFGFNIIPAKATPTEPFTASQFGISSPNRARFPGMPAIGLTNLFTVGPSGFSASDNQADTTTVGDTVTYTTGNHAMKFGGEYRYNRVRVEFDIFARGSITFTGALTNLAALAPLFTPGRRDAFTEFLVADAFPGFNPVFSIIGPGAAKRQVRAHDFALFFQDDWKIHPRLTLNLGVRYEYFGPFFDTEGRFVTFDPARFRANAPGNGFLQASNANPGIPNVPKIERGLVPPDRNNVAPRVGFAFRPLDSNRFVIRGGYGIYYDRPNSRVVNNQGLTYPYYTLALAQFSRPFANPFVPIPQQYPVGFPFIVPNDLFNPSLPVGPTNQPNIVIPVQGIYLNRNLRTPYVQQYSLGVQWEFIKDTQLEIAYVGSVGRKLTRFRNLNQTTSPNAVGTFTLSPLFSTIPTIGFGVHAQETTANSSYNSLQISVTRRLAKGLQGLFAYTWSHTIDNYSGQITSAGTSDVSADVGDQATFAGTRGTADFDRRHRVVASFVYDMPKFYRGDGALKYLVNDWQIAVVSIVQSGLPFNVISGRGLFDASRADFVPGFRGSAARSGDVRRRLDNYFNTAAFVVATGTGNFGNTGRNILRGPAQANNDISIIKFFPIGERQRVEFRTEFFNAFNQTNFANPVSTGAPLVPGGPPLNPNFGRILSTSTGPRLIQFAFKYSF